ncbi:MAG: hypothetical protein CVV49_14410 [Spirochaetae bacterium HGW-Spirochaetae-5]|nr:MAG: hypothetical protein CVV49_14410 [Spirochaetae bacterium HGW-Spirochaetae-5]
MNIIKFKMTILLLLISASLFYSFSCSNSPEAVYERMLDKYDDGKGGNISLLSEKFLMAFSGFQTDYDSLFFNKSVIMSVKGENIEILYPENVTVKGDQSISENITFADMNENSIVLGNNKGFCVFDKDGDPHTVYKTEKNDRIDAVALKDKNVIYHSEGKIFEFSSDSKKVRRMDSGVYHSPYKKFFRSSIFVTDRFITLATGIAGSYYISIFDGVSGSALITNVAASSMELNMGDNDLLYVRGGTGIWAVAKFEISTKKRSQFKGVGKIDNIFIAKDGFITLNGKKYSIEGFNGEQGLIPQNWNIIGVCRNKVLIEYGRIVYVIDFPVLLKRVIEMNQKTGDRVS